MSGFFIVFLDFKLKLSSNIYFITKEERNLSVANQIKRLRKYFAK